MGDGKSMELDQTGRISGRQVSVAFGPDRSTRTKDSKKRRTKEKVREKKKKKRGRRENKSRG